MQVNKNKYNNLARIFFRFKKEFVDLSLRFTQRKAIFLKRWQCPKSLLFTVECRETPFENNHFSKLQTLISNSMIR